MEHFQRITREYCTEPLGGFAYDHDANVGFHRVLAEILKGEDVADKNAVMVGDRLIGRQR